MAQWYRALREDYANQLVCDSGVREAGEDQSGATD
jgi:hypothetical protein